MNIFINRTQTNRLYTHGEMRVNGKFESHTVESTAAMLPSGRYTLRLIHKSARKRVLEIFRQSTSTNWTIGIGVSFIASGKTRTICIGRFLMPGALFKSARDYERLLKRLEKCKERNETIELYISDSSCCFRPPIHFWQEDSRHGNPPSSLHVVADIQGNITLSYPNGSVKHISIEQQMKIHEEAITKRNS